MCFNPGFHNTSRHPNIRFTPKSKKTNRSRQGQTGGPTDLQTDIQAEMRTGTQGDIQTDRYTNILRRHKARFIVHNHNRLGRNGPTTPHAEKHRGIVCSCHKLKSVVAHNAKASCDGTKRFTVHIHNRLGRNGPTSSPLTQRWTLR